MKILIVGEYSGFSKYLSRGLREIGHEAFVFSWGDGFKRIEQEDGITIDISNFAVLGRPIMGSHNLKRLFSNLKLSKKISSLSQYFDCALIINPCFIKQGHNILKPYPTICQIKSMLKSQDNIYLSACGNDFIFNSFLPLRGKVSDFILSKFTRSLDVDKINYLSFSEYIKGVIPVMIDYSEAYKYFEKQYKYRILPTIPLPFDTQSVVECGYNGGTINIFHGVTRPEEKGSPFIINAMKRIAEKYADKVKINIVSHLPLNEYLKILERADILIDQAYAKSYGMNAIEGLAMGKIVLSGNEPGNAEEFGVTDCPVVNIKPDADDIYNKLEQLVNNIDKVKQLSKESVQYARIIHDQKNVARKYIELFSRYNS